ncbi:zinc finger protein 501-like isoform X1 [Helicoverpa zea]|uniref:zinc finger protein 501-like isoform X1 n=1 Tax=Helicoverpa zea TaxID=7113 RepID=UPI001F55BAAF|nr:zinc finger protein 501-like isoform X1 [Helicoverpa zea]
MNFSEICRTCLKNNKNGLTPIFLSEDAQNMLPGLLLSCTGVQIKYNDGLPQNMCKNCMNNFNNNLKFRKQCKQAETLLLKIKTENYTNKDETLVKSHNYTEEQEDSNLKSELKSIKLEPTDTKFENKPLKLYLQHTESINISEINENTVFNEDNFTEDTVFKTEQNIDNETQYITNKKCTDVPYIVTDAVTDKTTRVICKLCTKELSIRSIDAHMMRRHPGADERKVRCELCDKYVMRNKMNRHRVMMHGSAGVKCGYCKSEFNSKEQLLDHVESCTAKVRKRKINESGRTMAECDICKMKMQRASLNKHKAVTHAGLRPVCEHCGKSFGNKFRLNEHYRAKHGYEKFQCGTCEFQSAGIVAMRNHERRHRGEKPFVCESCGADFHAAYLLMQHRHSHNTDKLVKCDLCPSRFKARDNLHMHKLTCHSKSRYTCTVCARRYKCRYYAVRHARLVHAAADPARIVQPAEQ